MKTLSLFAGLALCTTAVVAQRPAEITKPAVPQAVTAEEATAARKAGIEALNNVRGGGMTLFQEDFSNGFDGSNGNGAWTTADNADNSLWIWVAPGNQGYYADGTETGSAHPGGEFSTGNPPYSNYFPIESTTAGNGWMVFDPDFYNSPIADGYQDTEGSLTSPSMDFTGIASVIVDWESFFRYCCLPYAPVFLEVGTTVDGITTWTTFDAHGSFIESTNTASANPLPVSVDVSCVAADQDSVNLRFAYRQAPESQGSGYSHYYWGIDDVTVSSNDVMNDIEITQVTNGDVFGVWEYRVTPGEQAILEADGGLVAGVMYRNVGLENQTNVEVLVEILDGSGAVVGSTTEIIDTVFTYANAPTCPANAQDTLYLATGWEPAANGTYNLRITMTGDQEDATPLNNVLAKDIVYTDDEYGHDDENVLDGELRPRESDDFVDLFDPTGYGSFYHCPNAGSVAYGLAVKFGPNCGLDIAGGYDDLEFETRLYTLDGTATITDSPFDAAYWVFDPDWANLDGTTDIEIYLEFDDPIALGTLADDGNYYFAAVMSEFESPTELTVLANLNSDSDNSTGRFSKTGDGNFVWFGSQTSTPAVRLITSEREAVELLANNQGIRLDQNMPNPAAGTTTIRFEIGQSHDVVLEVRDGMGRLVNTNDMGTLGAGLHTVELNLDGWASGLYTYTLQVDGLRTTKKMTVK
ncbi:MAG: T9SS type A sorting domain-containing protein [Bacteroidetes bacterium]|nr:T9SS type A sorting domain-containing protein [Bacteroidota bacterium]